MNPCTLSDKAGLRIVRRRRAHAAGTSLLLTLVVLSAIVVLLVMLSRLVTVERRVTQGYSEMLRAEMAAKAGAAEASSVLVELFSKHPDSVTYWDPNMGATTTPGTVFMYRDAPPDKEYPGSATADVPPVVYAMPLVSGASARQYFPGNDYALSLPAASTADPGPGLGKPYVDINQTKRFGTRGQTGWIGTLPGATTLPGKANLEIRVPWVHVLKDPTQPENLSIDPATRLRKNPPVIRYAWWVEDESFKLNVNSSKGATRGDMLAELDAGGVLKPKPSLQGFFSAAVAEGVAQARDQLSGTGSKMLSTSQIAHSATVPTGSTPAEFAESYRYLFTTASSGLDQSRTGARRFNLNEAVKASYDGLPLNGQGEPDLSASGAPGKIQRAQGQITTAISSSSPRFGQRFYRTSTTLLVPTPSNYAANPPRNSATQVKSTAAEPHQAIYLKKLSANLFDYVSPYRNPTVLDAAGNVAVGLPLHSLHELELNMSSLNQVSPLLAVGKKALPYLTEYVMHARHVTSDVSATLAALYPSPPLPVPPNREFRVDIDHYFEFWNPTDTDISPASGDMGPSPVLVMQHQPPISAANNDPRYAGADVPEGRAFEIKLDGDFYKNSSGTTESIKFEAGKLTIITTDPEWATHAKNLKIASTANVYAAAALYAPGTTNRCDTGVSAPPHKAEVWSGDAPSVVTSTVSNVRSYILPCFYKDDGYPEIQMGPDNYVTKAGRLPKMLVANAYGLLTANLSLAVEGQTGKKNLVAFKDKGNRSNPELNNFKGSFVTGPLLGGDDPTASLEALTLDLNTESGSSMKINGMTADPDNLTASEVKKDSNLGTWPGSPMPAKLNFWPTDVASTTQAQTAAPLVIARKPMRSIGELGNVVDPLRYGGTGQDILTRRGGGRTLTVGQPDVLWNGSRASTASEAEMSLQVSRSRNWAAWRLADVFTVNRSTDLQGPAKMEVTGLYNPNGILRDQGLVLKALVAGLRFETGSASDPALQAGQFNTGNMEVDLLKSLTASQSQTADAGGPALAKYLAQRLMREHATRFSPLWERGEISQLELFNPTATKNQIKTGATTSTLLDRGREELSRRLIDLLTVKGNTFSIYVVGQSLGPNGEPVATKAQRVIIRLHPKFDPPLEDDFDPTDATAIEKRFRKPDKYDVEILSTEDA